MKMGDPHFQLWNGEWFDFHGQCDLVYLSEPTFHGVGLHIQIRTSPRFEYSFIETTAIKIGSDVLEIGSWGEYFLNGVDFSADKNPEEPIKLASLYPVSHTEVNKKRHIYEIDLLEKGEKIVVTTHKDVVAVQMVGATARNFKNSRGILGEFGSGNRLDRNGTVVEDDNMFGNEWQVQSDEPMLFQAARSPQHPLSCVMPPPKSAESRRLGQSVAEDKAKAACDHWDAGMKELCVFDVLATGDLDLAVSVPGAY